MPFNHFDDAGHAHMVDVSGKEPTVRRAEAAARVVLGADLVAKIAARDLVKGDVLGVARLAGIAATKQTPALIPLAHPLHLDHVALDFALEEEAVAVTCVVAARERTGVEMEAMTGATVAALTIYDMCKGEDKGIRIEDVRLLAKSGGRSGSWSAPPEEAR